MSVKMQPRLYSLVSMWCKLTSKRFWAVPDFSSCSVFRAYGKGSQKFFKKSNIKAEKLSYPCRLKKCNPSLNFFPKYHSKLVYLRSDNLQISQNFPSLSLQTNYKHADVNESTYTYKFAILLILRTKQTFPFVRFPVVNAIKNKNPPRF